MLFVVYKGVLSLITNDDNNFPTVFYKNNGDYQFNLLIDDGNFIVLTKSIPADHQDKQCAFILNYHNRKMKLKLLNSSAVSTIKIDNNFNVNATGVTINSATGNR